MPPLPNLAQHVRALAMLADVGHPWEDHRHDRRLQRLAALLEVHPDLWLEVTTRWSPEPRWEGRAVLIGGTTYRYHLWAVWPPSE